MDLESIWSDTLTGYVEATVMASGMQPGAWAKVGRSTKDKPEGEDLTWWEADGLRQLQSYDKWLKRTEWKFVAFDGVPGIEFPVEAKFGSHTVKGFIDAIMVNPEGQMICVDHKTGSRTPDSMLQMGLYAASLEAMGLPRPDLGCFWMTRKGGPTDPEPLDRYTVKFFTDMFDMFDKAVAQDIFIPHVGQYCRGCSVRDACYAVGGVDAYKFDRLHPSYRDLQSQDTNNPQEEL